MAIGKDDYELRAGPAIQSLPDRQSHVGTAAASNTANTKADPDSLSLDIRRIHSKEVSPDAELTKARPNLGECVPKLLVGNRCGSVDDDRDRGVRTDQGRQHNAS